MSLLDEGNTTTPEILTGDTTKNTGESSGANAGWLWDENTPGTGDRPVFLPEKYKSVADVAKAYKELESRLGTAPKEYDFSKGQSWIEPDYEPFIEMAEFARSKHVPQEVMDKMLESVGYYLDEFKTDMNEEKAKLGEKSTERLQILNNWARSNLSEKSFNALTAGMRTAEQIEALEEIRNKMLTNNTMVPGGNQSVVSGGMTLEEYRSELNANFAKYKTDPAFRKEMERKLENIVGRK
jgi:two-component SAPR family response regulator